MKGLSSRERLLCAFSHNEPDHVPLWNLWRRRGSVLNFSNTGPAEEAIRRTQAVLERGLDDTLLLEPPGPREDSIFTEEWNPKVHCRTWIEKPRFEEAEPIIVKEYKTPAGDLRQAVRLTADWPFGEELPITNDFNVSRSEEFLIKSTADFKALKYIFTAPSAQQLGRYREQAARLRAFATERDVLLEGGWIGLVDTAVWLFGMEPLIWKAVDEPGFVSELLEIIYTCEKDRIELLLDEKVDMITHSAWYELPQFWSPELYRRLIKPFLRREIDLCHSAGTPFCYILTSGSSLIVDDLLELGVDSLRGLDPVQGMEKDLAFMKQRAGGRITLWGGLNTAVTLNNGSPNEIRNAVHQAVETLAPGGGFVLHPVDAIFSDTPWENIEILIDAWKEVRAYP